MVLKLTNMTFEQYIDFRVKKFGKKEAKRFKKIDNNVFEYDCYLNLNTCLALENAKFIFVCSNNGKFIYRNI